VNKLLRITKKNLSYKMINNVKPITNSYLIPSRNYYCEKWIEEQEILKIKDQEFKKLVSVKLNDQDFFLYNEIKKNSEQNEKIISLLKKQNEDIEIMIKNLSK